MQELHAALLALQELDDAIIQAQARVDEFGPELDALEAPLAGVLKEYEATQARLAELRQEVHRLQRNSAQKRERLQASEERLGRVRNVREETAVRAEIDLVARALDADDADLRQQSEQATRADLKLDDLQRQADRVKAEIAARRDELIAGRTEAETELAVLRERRENQALRVDPQSRRLYERVRGGRSRLSLAPLTSEGACGNCFNVLPVQEQTEIRRGETLHRCEGCGVILYAP
ncbi:MAG TPA: C4-type zinc ribbon domain-containing protein [Longimicrobiales bacterium]|nr:C4-type zinc ribbon domain-containing protein [Longimicrobiales bacterium]